MNKKLLWKIEDFVATINLCVMLMSYCAIDSNNLLIDIVAVVSSILMLIYIGRRGGYNI